MYGTEAANGRGHWNNPDTHQVCDFVGNQDAVLIASPEYAHCVPGVLKNALDWVVASGELVDKPIALINTSARATHAWTSLAETLSVMSACGTRGVDYCRSAAGWTPTASLPTPRSHRR